MEGGNNTAANASSKAPKAAAFGMGGLDGTGGTSPVIRV
jgi:hypothetical protein